MRMEEKKKKEKIRNTSRYAERSFFESKGYLAPVGSIESVRKHFILRLFRWVLGKVTFYLHAFFLLFCITWKSAKNILGEKIENRIKLYRRDLEERYSLVRSSIKVIENLCMK